MGINVKNHRYVLMRHAQVMTGGALFPKAESLCRRAARDLAVLVAGYQSVKIFCSPLERARVTAELVRAELGQQGIKDVSLESVEWLRVMSSGFDERKVQDCLATNDDSFIVFLTHEPIISNFLEREIPRDSYCGIFRT